MIHFHTHWIFSGLPDLADLANPAGSIVDSLDRAEAAWVHEGTASALLSLR